ncbi:MAG: hypothetical protein QXW67_03720 [Candidatus Micrarchaeia archaeon]
MCFSGKDLTSESGLLKEIKTFLANDGKCEFLLMSPQSKRVRERGQEIGKDENTLIMNFENTIINLNDKFKRHYPGNIKVKIYDQLPLFRMNFIGNVLFLGLYGEERSYANIFYEIPTTSPLYHIFEKLFERTWEDGKDV